MLFLLTVIFLFQILFLFSVKECTSTPCKRCTRNRKRDQPGLNIAVITGPRPVADYPVDSVIVDDMISVELITGDPCLVIQDTVFRNLINNRFTICRIQVEVFKCEVRFSQVCRVRGSISRGMRNSYRTIRCSPTRSRSSRILPIRNPVSLLGNVRITSLPVGMMW